MRSHPCTHGIYLNAVKSHTCSNGNRGKISAKHKKCGSLSMWRAGLQRVSNSDGTVSCDLLLRWQQMERTLVRHSCCGILTPFAVHQPPYTLCTPHYPCRTRGAICTTNLDGQTCNTQDHSKAVHWYVSTDLMNEFSSSRSVNRRPED